MANEDCIFCKIVKREIKNEEVYRDEKVVVVKDIKPQSPVHLLLIPVAHFETPADFIEAIEHVPGHMFVVAARVAKQMGVDENGYRLVVNVGHDGGQVIKHLHMHLMGGRRLRDDM